MSDFESNHIQRMNFIRDELTNVSSMIGVVHHNSYMLSLDIETLRAQLKDLRTDLRHERLAIKLSLIQNVVSMFCETYNVDALDAACWDKIRSDYNLTADDAAKIRAGCLDGKRRTVRPISFPQAWYATIASPDVVASNNFWDKIRKILFADESAENFSALIDEDDCKKEKDDEDEDAEDDENEDAEDDENEDAEDENEDAEDDIGKVKRYEDPVEEEDEDAEEEARLDGVWFRARRCDDEKP